MHIPFPKILHEIKVQQTPSSPSHTSFFKPQKLKLRKGVYLGDTSPPPRREEPCGSCSSRTWWVLRSLAPMERAVGGAHGLPQLPARGDFSEHLGDLGLAEDLQELRLWEEAGRARCVCMKAAAHPWLRGSWVRGISTAPFGVWASLTTWGKFRPSRCQDGLVCGQRSSLLRVPVDPGNQEGRGPSQRLLMDPRRARRGVPLVFTFSV